MKEVINLDTGEILYFDALTAYEAMQKLLYYLGLKDISINDTINKTISGQTLYFEYDGKTWGIENT